MSEEIRDALKRLNELRAACSEIHLLIGRLQELQERDGLIAQEERDGLPPGASLH